MKRTLFVLNWVYLTVSFVVKSHLTFSSLEKLLSRYKEQRKPFICYYTVVS